MKDLFKFPDRGVSAVRPIDAAKEKVTVMDLAEHLAGAPLIREGREFKANCLVPDHPDKKPSLYINPNKYVWLCRSCNRGGSMIELACYAWGYDPKDGTQRAMAAADVLVTFGHELPQRPPNWFYRQERQRKVRNLLEEQRLEQVRRLVFRLLWVPLLSEVPKSMRKKQRVRRRRRRYSRRGWYTSEG